MPERRAVFQTSRRTLSRASVAHFTAWKLSMQSVAFLARSATTLPIHSAPSAERRLILAQRSLPSRSKDPFSVFLVAADRRPDEAPGVVVHDDRQVAVPALVADLV